jgi:hypothetical protein
MAAFVNSAATSFVTESEMSSFVSGSVASGTGFKFLTF